MRILPLLILTALLDTATAKEFKLPAGKPVASVDLADTWKPQPIPRGVQAQTEDGEVYLSIEATSDVNEMGTIIDESDALLKSHKVVLARATRLDNKFKINDLPAEELVYTGRDEDGPVTVSFTFVTIRDAAVVFTYWASTEGNKQHRPELAKIFGSLKPLVPPTAAAKPPR